MSNPDPFAVGSEEMQAVATYLSQMADAGFGQLPPRAAMRDVADMLFAFINYKPDVTTPVKAEAAAPMTVPQLRDYLTTRPPAVINNFWTGRFLTAQDKAVMLGEMAAAQNDPNGDKMLSYLLSQIPTS